jgi:hypothetical protein
MTFADSIRHTASMVRWTSDVVMDGYFAAFFSNDSVKGPSVTVS